MQLLTRSQPESYLGGSWTSLVPQKFPWLFLRSHGLMALSFPWSPLQGPPYRVFSLLSSELAILLASLLACYLASLLACQLASLLASKRPSEALK